MQILQKTSYERNSAVATSTSVKSQEIITLVLKIWQLEYSTTRIWILRTVDLDSWGGNNEYKKAIWISWVYKKLCLRPFHVHCDHIVDSHGKWLLHHFVLAPSVLTFAMCSLEYVMNSTLWCENEAARITLAHYRSDSYILCEKILKKWP